jgi:HAD superfamily hydrolase (TIGR01509 family)
MRNGCLATLAAVVDHCADLKPNRRVAPQRITLDPAERRDLAAFLHTRQCRRPLTRDPVWKDEALAMPAPQTSPVLTRPAAVLFDMDGLLLDTESISRSTMIAAMATLGLTMTEADFIPLIGVPDDVNRVHLAGVHGADFDYDAMRAAQARIKDAQWGDQRPLKPGARRIVEAIAAMGIPAAVATSSHRISADAHLGAMGLRPFFNAVRTRDDVANGKPHPDLYLAAAAALGMAPGDCLALEDSHNGVRAAHAAGVPVIMVPDLLPPTDEMHAKALAIASSLDLVCDWLLAIA